MGYVFVGGSFCPKADVSVLKSAPTLIQLKSDTARALATESCRFFHFVTLDFLQKPSNTHKRIVYVVIFVLLAFHVIFKDFRLVRMPFD